ncbi:MAG: diacylglycerol kinase family protein [Lachnospiraceae bacterium]|nr:diacylglycerol kinase family protein [Lachnospiraceae bacterium]
MIHIFVINSISTDPEFGTKLREHLEKRGDIRYFVFNTTHRGMEADIVEKMIHLFEGERLRIYACGGSGTMRNVMQGTGNYKNVELAFIPYGHTNDFLKMFGEDEVAFKDIDRVVDGHVEYIDYIRTNHGYALNSVSFGIDTELSVALDNVQELDIFGKKIPFLIAYLQALLSAKPKLLMYQIDKKVREGNVTELIVGNGAVLGGQMHFTDDADPTDGVMDYVIGINKTGFGIIKVLAQMIKGNMSEVRKTTVNGKCSSFKLKNFDGSNLSLNLDGEIVHGGSEWEIEIVQKGMAFVIPKGVTMKF